MMEGSERALAGLVRIVMRGVGASKIGDRWVSTGGGSDRVRVLSGLVRIVIRGGDLHAADDFGAALCGNGLLVTFATVLRVISIDCIVAVDLGGRLTIYQGIAPSSLAPTD